MGTEKLTQDSNIVDLEIPRELSKLDSNIVDLEITISELLNKLSPVLRSQEAIAVEEAAESGTTTELGSMIRQFTFRIKTLRDKAVESLNTIEL